MIVNQPLTLPAQYPDYAIMPPPRAEKTGSGAGCFRRR